jgi:hypothetical protein
MLAKFLTVLLRAVPSGAQTQLTQSGPASSAARTIL